MLETERRCDDCGAQVDPNAGYCPDCWGEHLVVVSGAALANLRAWEEYVQERHNPWGGEQTYTCTQCGKRTTEIADTGAYGFLCGQCFNQLFY